MPRVLFIQNGEYDQPGLFATVLRELGVEVEIVHAWRGESVPQRPESWSGVALGGGAMSAYQEEEFPFLRREAVLFENARLRGIPVLGMCLGAQIMAGAAGGKVFLNRAKEIGFFPLEFTPAAAADPLWSPHVGGFSPVHWHRDTFSLPPESVLLASTALTPHQLFRLDECHYGLQFHLEIDRPLLTEMVLPDVEPLAREGVDAEAFLQDAATALPIVEPIARRFFTQWAGFLR